MIASDLTLVTYTYNDAPLVEALLDDVASWALRPGRMVVVDDGSHTPFGAPADGAGGVPVDVLHLPGNSGPAQAKRAGISSITSGLILSMDCDIRPDAHWTERAVPLARETATGLVGAAVASGQGGQDAASRYLARHKPLSPDPAAPAFLSGGIWLLRADVWVAADGFGDLTGKTHEDFIFSRRVRDAGLALRVDPGPPVRQVRRLDRRAVASQHAAYLGHSVRTVIEKHGFAQGLSPLLEDMTHRMVDNALEGDTPLIYIDLLLLARLVDFLFQHKTRFIPGVSLVPAGFAAALEKALSNHPGILELLKADLAAMGRPLPSSAGATAMQREPWIVALSILGPLEESGSLDTLEQVGLALLHDEDTHSAYDFHYLREGS